jgi:hypothetical protein
MRKNLFIKANYLSDKVYLVYETEKSIQLKVGEYEVRIYYKDHDLKFWCTCKHASLKPELLCSHVMACITAIVKNDIKKPQQERDSGTLDNESNNLQIID